MEALAILALMGGWKEPTPPTTVLDTEATYYGEGLMETVRQNRGIDLLPGEICVALNSAADLGRPVWFEYEGDLYTGRSCDCAQENHYQEREAQNRGLEVPYWLAKMWGMRGPVPVTVYFSPPPGWMDLPRPI